MTTNIDALIHLPCVNAGPWKHFRGYYERRVTFKCDHDNCRYALLKVYTDDEGAAMISIGIDGVVRELSVGEYTDPFSTANETLVALASECNRRTNTNGDAR